MDLFYLYIYIYTHTYITGKYNTYMTYFGVTTFVKKILTIKFRFVFSYNLLSSHKKANLCTEVQLQCPLGPQITRFKYKMTYRMP